MTAPTRPATIQRSHGVLLTGVFAMLVAAVLVLLPAPAAHAEDVSDWLSWVNNLRAANGVGPLELDGEQSALAQQRAQINASNGNLVHTSNLAAGVSETWTKLGENIGEGPSTGAIADAFLHSPRHFANLVDPAFNRIGIGVVWVADPATGGQKQFVTHRFMSTPGSPAPTAAPPVETAPPVTRPPVTRPPVTAPPTTARPRPTTPPTTVPAPTTTTTTAPPAPALAPAQAEPEQVAAVLDALHEL